MEYYHIVLAREGTFGWGITRDRRFIVGVGRTNSRAVRHVILICMYLLFSLEFTPLMGCIARERHRPISQQGRHKKAHSQHIVSEMGNDSFKEA